MIKKTLLIIAVAFSFASCSTTIRTAKSYDVSGSVSSGTNTAELTISTKKAALKDWEPKGKIKGGGKENVKQAAIAELLQQNGDADVLVAPQFEYTIKKGEIKKITVTGYPAKYTKF
ncbi:MAG: hypothetical protein IKO99_03930 [Bacteroidales bacterium]|nr:hypothetical protein [Bacteroidales bacterium]